MENSFTCRTSRQGSAEAGIGQPVERDIIQIRYSHGDEVSGNFNDTAIEFLKTRSGDTERDWGK